MKELNKIFQIGFNKCGTTSFFHLFENFTNPCLKPIHWDDGRLAFKIYNNNKENIKLLDGYEDYIFFSDMECVIDNNIYEAFRLYKELDKQYPNSKFILNVRNQENWVKSRLKHMGGRYKVFYYGVSNFDNLDNYLINHRKYSLFQRVDEILNYLINNNINIPKDEDVANKWRKEWEEHINEVKEYFKDRPDDLLIYDIENDSIDKIKLFFKDYVVFNTNIFPLKNNKI